MNIFALIKGINIVLGCICIGLEAHVYSETHFIPFPTIDVIFFMVVASAVVESFIALATAYRYKDIIDNFQIIDYIQRGIACIALLVIGGLLIHSSFWVETNCRKYAGHAGLGWHYNHCQLTRVKLAAGIVCLVNAIFHGIAKKGLGQNLTPETYPHFNQPPNYPEGFPSTYNTPKYQISTPANVIQQNTSNPSSFRNQGQYYNQDSRFQTQNPSGYQYNQNQPSMPINYPQQQQRY